MKVLLKSFFFALTLSILGYSAVIADARIEISPEPGGRTCCQYQVDCPETETCEWIHPYCSADKNYICKKASVE